MIQVRIVGRDGLVPDFRIVLGRGIGQVRTNVLLQTLVYSFNGVDAGHQK